VDCPPRFSTPRTPERQTLGAYAPNIARQLGTPLMPWQQHVLDVALEIDSATGQFAYQHVVLTVPRQSGKTTLILTLILLRCMGGAGQIVSYTAQTANDATKKMQNTWMPALEQTGFSRHFIPRKKNGDVGLFFGNGSRAQIVASTSKSGHGDTLDLGIIDEGFAQPDDRLEQAMKPAMVTRLQPPHVGAQFWVVSTAGTQEMSPYLWRQVSSARDAAMADPMDPQTWRSCMPALGHTVREEDVRGFAEGMELNEFRRAFLNQWTVARHDPVINLESWQTLAVDAEPDISGSVALSFDVTPDSGWSSIAGASRLGSLDHLDVIEHERGTDWLANRLGVYVRSHDVSAVVYDPSSPAAAVAARVDDPTLKAKLVAASARDFGEACQMLFTGVADLTIGHNRDPELLAALDGAGRKSAGDLWRWSRTSTSVDISPLVAVTLALWGLKTQRTSEPIVWDISSMVEQITAEMKAEQAKSASSTA
jgi:hypothetical protein